MKTILAVILLLPILSFGQAVDPVDDRYFINGIFILVAVIAAIIFFSTRSREEKKRIDKTAAVLNKETKESSKEKRNKPILTSIGLVFFMIGLIGFINQLPYEFMGDNTGFSIPISMLSIGTLLSVVAFFRGERLRTIPIIILSIPFLVLLLALVFFVFILVSC